MRRIPPWPGHCPAPKNSTQFRRSSRVSLGSTTPHHTRQLVDVTVTPATLLAELARLFPPVPASHCTSSVHANRIGTEAPLARSYYYDWRTLFLVRHQNYEGRPSWPKSRRAGSDGARSTVSPSGGVVHARYGLWHPRGSLAVETVWHPHASHRDVVDSNCCFARCTPRVRGGDAVLRVWWYSLAHMMGTGGTRTDANERKVSNREEPIYGWGSPAIYSIYHYPQPDAKAHGASTRPMFNEPRLMGVYYAIPGLPQPPPNVTTTSPAKRGRGDDEGFSDGSTAVQGTVLSLQSYVSFVVPSYRTGMECDAASSSSSAPVAPKASHAFLFDEPRHFARSDTTRGWIGNSRAYWQCVPLDDYLRQWPVCSLPTRPCDATSARQLGDAAALSHGTLSVSSPQPLASSLTAQLGVTVLLMLERRIVSFSLLMHTHNPFLATKEDLDASHAASVAFAFIRSPVQEDDPTHGLETWFRTTSNRRTTRKKIQMHVCPGDPERRSPHVDVEGCDDRTGQPSVTHTVLVRDEEDKSYRLPYEAFQSRTKQRAASGTRADPRTRASYTLQWYTEEDRRQRACEQLLCLFLTRPPPEAPPHTCVNVKPVLISPFPPSSQLLRNKSLFSNPNALAEEMRYGRLVIHV